MRFLGDYIDGDKYFRVSRENHNLDRARTQFKLVSDMERLLPDMEKIIADIKKCKQNKKQYNTADKYKNIFLFSRHARWLNILLKFV